MADALEESMAQWVFIIHRCITSTLQTWQLKMAQIIYYLTRFLEFP